MNSRSKSGLTLPFTTPATDALPEMYRDPRGNWVSTRVSYFAIAYNTKMVPPDQVPKSYDDLLDPRWKGKLAWRIGTSSGTPLFITTIRLSRGEEKANEYFDRLAQQKMINFGSGSARTLVDRVIAGEFPIALNIFAHHPLISKAKGAPVNTQLLDPVPSTAGTMIVPKGVRHPYAAMLLADFIVSQEGPVPPAPVCGSCHSIPPTSGEHAFHYPSRVSSCSTCHGAGYSPTAVTAATHNNGAVNVLSSLNFNATTSTCGSPGCHGARAW